jgi:hypothetical protein
MSATPFDSDIFLVESEPVVGDSAAVTQAPDFSTCMTQLSKLLRSGRKIFGVRYAGGQVSPTVLDGMLRLLSRRSILQRLANSFGLDQSQTESSFGHLLMQDALIVQDFLQGWNEVTATASDHQSKTSTPESGAVSGAVNTPAPKAPPIYPAPESDLPLSIDNLGKGLSAEPQIGLGGTAA